MTKNVSIKGKVALVTGSNRGIGKAITIALLEQGASKVYAAARNIDSVADLKETYGDKLVPLELDVTNDETIAKAAETANDVEILVNNAGVLHMGSFTGGNLADSMHKNFHVNVWGLAKVTEAFLKTIQEKDSAAIANVCSMVSFAAMPMGLTYSASKAAAHSLTQGLRAELQKTNVLVTGVYPGPIQTDMTKGFDMQMDSPENVAKAVLAVLKMVMNTFSLMQCLVKWVHYTLLHQKK